MFLASGMIPDKSQAIAAHLPYLRRYARAMTGSRERGDALAEAALISLIDEDGFAADVDPKIALFRQLQDDYGGTVAMLGTDLGEAASKAQRHLSRLTPGSRDALLLKAVEMFTEDEIAEIMRTDAEDVDRLIRVARLDLARAITGRFLVIEDETAIAADLSKIVTGMGHDLVGTAANAEDAVEIAAEEDPDLILSDVRLSDGGSGIEAVSRILGDHPRKPVIFITGYPEDLLTGNGREPAFLIAKPYSEDEVRSAVSQAMFFAPSRRVRT